MLMPPLKYRLVLLVLLFSSFLFFISCGDDELNDQKGAVTFSFSVKSQDGARVADDVDLEKIVLSRAIWIHLQRRALVHKNKTIIF